MSVVRDRNIFVDNDACITWMGSGTFQCDGVAFILIVLELGEGGSAETL